MLIKEIVSRLTVLCACFIFLVQPVYAADVVINEFQIEPTNIQWVELYNTGSSGQDISGWIIDDDSGGSSSKYTVPAGTFLPPNTCITFDSGSFDWNKSTPDSARLLNGDIVLDSYSYTASPGDGISFGRSPDGTGSWITYSSTTKGKLNSNGVLCLAPTPTPTVTPTDSPTPSLTPTKTPTPTHTPSPTNSPTSAPSTTSTNTPTQTKAISSTPTRAPSPMPSATTTGEILGLSDSGFATPANTLVATPSGTLKPFIISFALIGAGFGILSLLVLWQKRDLFRRPNPPNDIIS